MGLFSWLQPTDSRKIDPVAAGQELVDAVLLQQDLEVLSRVLEETGDSTVTPEQRRERIALVLIATCNRVLAGLQNHPAAQVVADSLCDGVTSCGFETEEERIEFYELIMKRLSEAGVFYLGLLLGQPFGGRGPARWFLLQESLPRPMMGAQRIGAEMRSDLATGIS